MHPYAPPTLLLTAAAFAGTVTAQDLVYYKFDGGCGNEVINYAAGGQAIPQNGILETNNTSATFNSWTTGVHGGALTGGSNTSGNTYYNRTRTGWTNPNHSGDFTMAFFMKERNSPGTSLSYLHSGAGSFRLFTNGIANQGLYQRVIVASGGVGGGRDLHLQTDVQTPASQRWVHIALVIDSATQTATWYIDGAVDTVVQNVPNALIQETGEVRVGMHSSTTYPGTYDLDEWIFSTRAYAATEIAALASSGTMAADGTYDSDITSQCGQLGLVGTGGTPDLGNGGYGLEVSGPNPGLFAVFVGSSKCTFAGGTFKLPLDGSLLHPKAAGCQVLADIDLTSTVGCPHRQPPAGPQRPDADRLHGLRPGRPAQSRHLARRDEQRCGHRHRPVTGPARGYLASTRPGGRTPLPSRSRPSPRSFRARSASARSSSTMSGCRSATSCLSPGSVARSKRLSPISARP